MTDTHVVSALKEKRIQVASQIKSPQGQLRQAVIDLDHVEAARRLFDPQHWSRNRGLIRSMSGPGQQLLWEVVRQPKISA